MNSKIREYNDFINDIKDGIRNVETFTEGIDFEKFSKDILIQKAVIRCLEEIGEGAKHIPDEIKKKHQGIPWKEAAGLRDKLIHHYWGVDLQIVWDVVKNDLLILKKTLSEAGL